MIALLDNKTDTSSNSNLDQQGLFLWNFLYDLYAPIMYGSILRIINNKKHAENILLEAFLLLKETQLCSKLRKPLSLGLLYHTHNVAVNYLRQKKLKLKVDSSFYTQNPLLKNLNIRSHSTMLARQIGKMQEQKIPIHLRNQFSVLNEKPPLQLALPSTSLSSFYFYMKNSY